MEREKLSDFRGVYAQANPDGSRSFLPRLIILGEVQDLGSFGTAQEAALAYDICKLHAALYHGKDIDDIKLNNSAATYLSNLAFANLRDNAEPKECAELIRSGALLDQFSSRFRPQLRGTSHQRAAHAPPSAPGLHPKREPSPQPPQQPRQPVRNQSQPSLAERPTSGVAGEAAAATQPAAPREPPEPEASAHVPAASRVAAAAAEDDAAAKKRKARWVMYEGMHTVWISERTAAGNSLSIPAFVKEKVFRGVEDGDAIVAVNMRSKKEYKWKYRNLRKESDSTDKHYLTEMKRFVTELHVQCGDVLQVQPTGAHAVEFVVHRSNTDFVLKFLAYMDTKPPSEPKAGGSDMVGGSRQQGEGDGVRKLAAGGARDATPRHQQPQLPRQGEAQQGGVQARQAPGGQASPTQDLPSPFAVAAVGLRARQGGPGQAPREGPKPAAKGARGWAEYPAGSGQYAVAVSEGMLRSAQMSMPAAVWSSLIAGQRAEVDDFVKAIHSGNGKGWPLTPQPNHESGGGVLKGLGVLLRVNTVVVGDVLAFKMDDPTPEGRGAIRFRVWRDGTEEAAGLKRHLEQVRRTKSVPAGTRLPPKVRSEAAGASEASGKGRGSDAGGSGPLPRSASSGPHVSPPHQASTKHTAAARGAEAPMGAAAGGKAAARQQQLQQQQHPPKRAQVLVDSSSSEEMDVDGEGERGGSGPGQQQRQEQQQSVQRRVSDSSPKRKAGDDADGSHGAKRPAVATKARPAAAEAGGRGMEASCNLPVQPRRASSPTGDEGLTGPLAAGGHGAGAGHPSAAVDQGGPRQEPAVAAPAAEVQQQDLSHLPFKKRMLLQAQAQANAAPSAGASAAQSGGASAHPDVARAGMEGAGDSQGDSVRRRAAGTAQQHRLAHRGAAAVGGAEGLAEDDVSPRGAGHGAREGYFGAEPPLHADQGLPTPTSPAPPLHDTHKHHPPAHRQQQQQLQGGEEEVGMPAQLSRGLPRAGRAAGARQTSPAERSSGTAGDRPQLQNLGSFTAAAGAAGGSADRQGTSQRAHDPAHHPPPPQQQQAQQQQQECSAAPAGVQPSASAAMGSAGLGPEGLADPHLLFNDEVAVIKEMMRLVDMVAAVGKVTPELAADLKMGLLGLTPLNRWCAYSTLKPLYDVASWDKLVECLKKAVHLD